MKDDPELARLVCRPHCRFYRPDAKEDLACAGYRFLKTRLAGPQRSEALDAARALASLARPPAAFDHQPRIEAALCAACPFRADDCDFMSPAPPPASVPCGGYVLIARLLDEAVGEVEDWLGRPA